MPPSEYVAPAGFGVIVGPCADPLYVNDVGEIENEVEAGLMPQFELPVPV
jgi:hypothetical protein